jgi:hypothetical protein
MGMTMAVHKTIIWSCRSRCLCRLVVTCWGGRFCTGSSVLVLAPLHEASAKVVDDERQHEPSHEDGRSRAFVLKLAKARVAKHQVCMREEMNEGSRDDDARAELLKDDKDDVVL